jgi:hypothetical protein
VAGAVLCRLLSYHVLIACYELPVRANFLLRCLSFDRGRKHCAVAWLLFFVFGTEQDLDAAGVPRLLAK